MASTIGPSKALKEWRFKPGTQNGVPVPVLVAIEMEFNVRTRSPQAR